MAFVTTGFVRRSAMPGVSESLGRPEIEKLLYQFDHAWQVGTPPQIEDYLKAYAGIPLRSLPSAERGKEDSHRRQFLEELVKIDLEYRWRRKPSSGNPWALQDYVARFPELGRLDPLPLE